MCSIKNAVIGDNVNGSNDVTPPKTGITKSFLDEFVVGLYSGVITEYNLSTELYSLVGDYFDNALKMGFDVDFEKGSEAEKTYLKLRSNLWHFGAAKQYTQNREILRSFVAPLEEIPFKDFKDVADSILANYNDNYLKTEWRTAVANSQSARDWGQLMEDDTIEWIEYITQEDVLVRPAHAKLNGARYKKTDKFWDLYFPPNDYNCRCFTVNHDVDTKKKVISNPPEAGEAGFPMSFAVNSGKQKIIFPNSHPYFRIAKGDKIFRESNYGLPII